MDRQLLYRQETPGGAFEAINTMFWWYRKADECFAYLVDVSSLDHFAGSEWFERGWTLQELLGPTSVVFFTRAWIVAGHKSATPDKEVTRWRGPVLNGTVSQLTGVPLDVLRDISAIQRHSVDEGMAWTRGRKTTKVEDRTYSIIGLFGVHMPLIYGEGHENARVRLAEEISKRYANDVRNALKDEGVTRCISRQRHGYNHMPTNVSPPQHLDHLNETPEHRGELADGRRAQGPGLQNLEPKGRSANEAATSYFRRLLNIEGSRLRIAEERLALERAGEMHTIEERGVYGLPSLTCSPRNPNALSGQTFVHGRWNGEADSLVSSLSPVSSYKADDKERYVYEMEGSMPTIKKRDGHEMTEKDVLAHREKVYSGVEDLRRKKVGKYMNYGYTTTSREVPGRVSRADTTMIGGQGVAIREPSQMEIDFGLHRQFSFDGRSVGD